MKILIILFAITAFGSFTRAEENKISADLDKNSQSETRAPRPTRSEFFYLPAPDTAAANLYFHSQSLPQNIFQDVEYSDQLAVLRSGTTQITGFEYTNGIAKNTYLQTDISYRRTSWTESYNVDGIKEGPVESKGLGNINIRYIRAATFEKSSLIYGMETSWSPKAAIKPTFYSEGNAFTGITTFSPFIGYEATSRRGIWGIKLQHVLFGEYLYLDGTHESSGSEKTDVKLALDGFFEFPLASFVDTGVNITFGQDKIFDSNPEHRLLRYNGRLYSNFHFIKDTDLLLSFGAATVETPSPDANSYTPTPETTTDIGFNLRKTL